MTPDIQIHDIFRILNVLMSFSVIGLIIGTLRHHRAFQPGVLRVGLSVTVILTGVLAGSLQAIMADSPPSSSTPFFTVGLATLLTGVLRARHTTHQKPSHQRRHP